MTLKQAGKVDVSRRIVMNSIPIRHGTRPRLLTGHNKEQAKVIDSEEMKKIPCV